jgi:hypothetical protein
LERLRKQVLYAVEDAHDAGFSVGEDLSVNDIATSRTTAELATRQAQANSDLDKPTIPPAVGAIRSDLGHGPGHAQDIRRPLGLVRTPSVEALTPVAEFYARRNFTVASRSHVAGLHLQADDGPFIAGSGSLVTGSTLALVMSMAGRVAYVDELDGPGVQLLRSRVPARAL